MSTPILIKQYISENPEHRLFEIRSADKERKNIQQIIEIYRSIMNKRKAIFEKGIGHGNEIFECFVFANNILLSKQVRIEQCELIPFEGLKCLDQFNLIQNYLKKHGGPSIDNTDEVFARSQREQPTAVVHFPLVFADTKENAGDAAESEARIILDLYGLQRGSPSNIFGSFIIQIRTKASFYRIHISHYKGNLLVGDMSGEDPQIIQNQLAKIRTKKSLLLFISLYKEARQENDIEFAYFRFWNILEVIARSKNVVGQPKTDFDGTIMTNRKGKPIPIGDKAEEIVLELLRQVLVHKHFAINSFKSDLAQGSLEEQIAIWYRHRCCVVHSGGCFPDDRNYCKVAENKYIKCKNANDEIISKSKKRDLFFDSYFRTLRTITEIILNHELGI